MSEENREARELLEFSANHEQDYFNTFDACNNLVDQALLSHKKQWDHIEVCEKHIKGNRPKDPAKLKKANQSFSNNWNYFKARAKITSDVAENIAALNDAIYLMIPEFRRPKKDDDLLFLGSDEDRGVISMKISRVFADTLYRESRWSSYLNRIEYPAYSFGYCAVTFSEDDWLGDPTHPREIAFEDNTKPDKITTFVTFEIMKAKYLWEKWDNARKAETAYRLSEEIDSRSVDISKTNWSVKGLQSVLWNALGSELRQSRYVGESSSAGKYVVWDEVSKDFYKDPYMWIQNTHNVTVAKIYHRELNGEWTETYIPINNEWQREKKNNSNAPVKSSGFRAADKIIFKRKWGEKSQDEVIVLVKDSGFAEYGFISELRGVAKYAVEDGMRNNRKRNNIEDKLLFAGQPMFFKGNTQDQRKFKIMPASGFTLIDRGVELAPNQPTFDLGNHIQSIALDEGSYQRETAQFNPKVEGRLTSRPVKDEISTISSEVARLKGAKSDVKLSDYSVLLFNILMNLKKIKSPSMGDVGKKGYDYFYDELEYELRDYIPEKEDNVRGWIKKVLGAVITTKIEPFAGDPESIQFAMSMAETSFARNRLKRMLLISQGFPRREVDRIAPLTADSLRNLKDERIAAIENDMLMTTNDVVIEETDDHIDHLNSHFEKFAKVFQAVTEGRLDPIEAFKWLTNVLVHSELHLQMVQRDPVYRHAYESMLEVFTEFTQKLNQLRSFAERTQKARQEQAEAPQLSEKDKRELAIKEFNAQKKEERTNALTINKARSNEVEQQHRHRMEEEDSAHKRRLEELETLSKINLDKVKTAASVLN